MVREILLFGAFSDEKGGSKMGQVRIDPRKQFSKKLARWTAVFWFVYLTWLSVVMLLAPSTGMYVVYLSIVVTVVMLLNIWTYMKNSIAEKMIFGMLDKTKLQLNVGPISSNEEHEADEGVESNG